MKQLTLIKVAGVVVSLAAAGIAQAATVTHTVDYQEVHPDGTVLNTYDDVAYGSYVGAGFVYVPGSDRIYVDGAEVLTQSDLDNLNKKFKLNSDAIGSLTNTIAEISNIKTALANLEVAEDTTLTEAEVDAFVANNGYATETYVDDSFDRIVSEYVEVYTSTGETYIDQYGVTVYQYDGEGDVTVSVDGKEESLLDNAADIDALEANTLAIDGEGKVTKPGGPKTYTLDGETWTDNGFGSFYNANNPSSYSESHLVNLGATLTLIDLVTESELKAAIDGIEVTDGVAYDDSDIKSDLANTKQGLSNLNSNIVDIEGDIRDLQNEQTFVDGYAGNDVVIGAALEVQDNVTISADLTVTGDINGVNIGYLADDAWANTQAIESNDVDISLNSTAITTKQDKLTEEQIAAFTADSDTQLSDEDIAAFGYIKSYVDTDTDTQLTETQVDEFVSNNGYLTADDLTDFNGSVQITEVENNYDDSEIKTAITTKQDKLTQEQLDSFTADSDTQLSDEDIAAFGYIKTDTNTQLSDADIAEFGYIKSYTDTNTQLSETDVDNFVSNNGYATTTYVDEAVNNIEIGEVNLDGYLTNEVDNGEIEELTAENASAEILATLASLKALKAELTDAITEAKETTEEAQAIVDAEQDRKAAAIAAEATATAAASEAFANSLVGKWTNDILIQADTTPIDIQNAIKEQRAAIIDALNEGRSNDDQITTDDLSAQTKIDTAQNAAIAANTAAILKNSADIKDLQDVDQALFDYFDVEYVDGKIVKKAPAVSKGGAKVGRDSTDRLHKWDAMMWHKVAQAKRLDTPTYFKNRWGQVIDLRGVSHLHMGKFVMTKEYVAATGLNSVWVSGTYN